MFNLLFSIVELPKILTNYIGVWYVIILNAFGILAIIFKVLEYQVKKRGGMFVLSTLANVCWVLYFILYGNLASTLTCTLNVIKMLIFMRRDTCQWAKSIVWLWVFLIAQVLVAVFTMNSILDIFAVTAGFVGIFAYYVISGKSYRIISFIHMSLWLVSSSLFFYPIALISDLFSTISCGLAIYRFDIRKDRKVENQTNSKENSKTHLQD